MIYRLSLPMRTTDRYAGLPPFEKVLKIALAEFAVDRLTLSSKLYKIWAPRIFHSSNVTVKEKETKDRRRVSELVEGNTR